jgi:hypothetical protein
MGIGMNEASMLIKKIMEKEGINQTELAEKMGCARQNINQLLNRNGKSMRYDSFENIIKVLGYEISLKKLVK